MDEYTRAFVKVLRDKMNKKQVSQKELADAIGVAKTTLNAWYTGRAMPRAGKVELLARFFDCSIEDFLPSAKPIKDDYDDIDTDLAANLILTPRVMAIMQAFQTLTPEQQQLIADIIRNMK